MTNLWRSLRSPPSTRSSSPLGLEQWAEMFSYGGLSYSTWPGVIQTFAGMPNEEDIGTDFLGYSEGLFKRNGVIFACMMVRQLLFAEARFKFRRLSTGRPGELFGNQDLRALEQPWPGATTGDLLSRVIQDSDLAGNFYGYRRSYADDRIVRLRPDWVTIILGSLTRDNVVAGDLDCELVGYLYHPQGPAGGRDPIVLPRENVAHFAPIPDPTATYRGMSWLTPIIRELISDNQATSHKLKFWEQGATPNMVVKIDPAVRAEKFKEWVELIKDQTEGVANAYKTLFLGGGADATVVGTDFRQMDFAQVIGKAETRIAAASGVPAVIVGLSEGLASATYSNFQQARRRLSDGTMRPLWRNVAGSFAPLIRIPAGCELSYDDTDIPFLAEDAKDLAEVQTAQATAINTLVTAGFKPESAVAAITAGDLNRLSHTGMVSVQLEPPGTPRDPRPPTPGGPPAANGTPPAPAGSTN